MSEPYGASKALPMRESAGDFAKWLKLQSPTVPVEFANLLIDLFCGAGRAARGSVGRRGHRLHHAWTPARVNP